jgi:hypothetical protein
VKRNYAPAVREIDIAKIGPTESITAPDCPRCHESRWFSTLFALGVTARIRIPFVFLTVFVVWAIRIRGT